MKQEIKLEQYYSGDHDWNKFVEIARQNIVIPINLKNSLSKKFVNNEDIAIVIYYRMLDDSLEWITRKIPALDGLTPIECLESTELITRLKEGLLRMH